MGSTFIPSRCAKIDEVGPNVLIRGNMPLTESGSYALREVRDASGVADLAERMLVEVPIIDNVGERAQFEAILRAFGASPGALPASCWPWWVHGVDGNARRGGPLRTEGLEVDGFVLWRPFEGLPEGEDPAPFLGRPGWDFSGFLDTVASLMTTLDGAAIYVHCQLGADRTGAFHTGYLMRTRGIGLAEAAERADAATSAGPPNADYRRLLEAYAASLTTP